MNLTNKRADIPDFLRVIEARILKPFAARVKPENRLGLFHQAVARAANVARGNVDELRSGAFREGNEVLNPVHVRTEARVHGREKLDQPRRVDHRAHATPQTLGGRGV